MISYAPVGGSVGAHVDQYDVFLLQADGVREWRIENTARQKNPASVSSTISILGDFVADETWELQAGDILYLPPQFAHHGIAKTEPCMTWSIGFRAPSVDEMLPELLNYLLEDGRTSERFKDPHRTPTSTPGRIDSADIAAIRSMLASALQQSDETLNHWIGRCITEPKELRDEVVTSKMTQSDIEAHLSTGGTLLANSQMRLAYSQSGDQTTLFANGDAFNCDLSLAEAICNRYAVANTDISGAEHHNFVTMLCQKQILILEDHRD